MRCYLKDLLAAFPVWTKLKGNVVLWPVFTPSAAVMNLNRPISFFFNHL